MMLGIVMSTAVSRRIAFEILFGYKKTYGLHGYESSVEAFILSLARGSKSGWMR